MKNPRVKKAIIIASSVVIVLVVLIGFFFNFVSFSPALISYNEQQQINEGLYSLHGGYGDYYWYYSGGRNDFCRCYGRENGYTLVYYADHNLTMKYEYIADIDGVVFASPKHFSFYAYKDGKLIDIADAYQQGLISREALLKAKEYHDQCQKEIAAAWGK